MANHIEENIISQILTHPQADRIVERLNNALKEEKEKRLLFYNDITEQEKAEFINGEIVVHSPVKKKHNEVSSQLFCVLGTFVKKLKLGFTGIEKILIQLSRNDYEPDICFFGQEKAKDFTDDQVFFPVPDFVVEVLSKSTEKRDRGIKFDDYERHGVLEYWIIDPDTETIEQYVLNEEGKYELKRKIDNGTIESVAIKGFKIPVAALFDEQVNFETLKEILSMSV